MASSPAPGLTGTGLDGSNPPCRWTRPGIACLACHCVGPRKRGLPPRSPSSWSRGQQHGFRARHRGVGIGRSEEVERGADAVVNREQHVGADCVGAARAAYLRSRRAVVIAPEILPLITTNSALLASSPGPASRTPPLIVVFPSPTEMPAWLMPILSLPVVESAIVSKPFKPPGSAPSPAAGTPPAGHTAPPPSAAPAAAQHPAFRASPAPPPPVRPAPGDRRSPPASRSRPA